MHDRAHNSPHHAHVHQREYFQEQTIRPVNRHVINDVERLFEVGYVMA